MTLSYSITALKWNGGIHMSDYTRRFEIVPEKELDSKEVLQIVYRALQEKGYNPINQIVGYLLSEDPTYITNYNNARSLIRHLDRDELMQDLIKSYLNL
jgi:uncharacterized protein (UPF0297 family)